MAASKIAIIILHWGDPKDTAELLQSLAKVREPAFKVFLIDQTLELDLELPDFVELVRPSGNLGFAGGNNLGLKKAIDEDYDYALLLNNDTVVPPEFLAKLTAVLESQPKAAAVAPTILYSDPPDDVWFAGGTLSLRRGEAWHHGVIPSQLGQPGGHLKMDQITATQPQLVSFLTGCCLLMRLDAMRQIGVLDDRYFVYWEDADWCARATRLGYELYWQPQAQITHKVSSALGVNSPTYLYYIFRNNLLFVRKFVKWPWKLYAWSVLIKKVAKEKLKILVRYRKNYGQYFRLIVKAFWDNTRRHYGQLEEPK